MERIKPWDLLGKPDKQKILDEYIAQLKKNNYENSCKIKNNSYGISYFSNDRLTGSNVILSNNNSNNNMITSWNDAGISVTC